MEDGIEDGVEDDGMKDGVVPVSIVSVMAAPAVMASVIMDFVNVDSFQGEPGLA